MRQLVLDTETTGLKTEDGHRLIELAVLEVVNRRKTDAVRHYYFNPERPVDAEATAVHGFTWEMLQDKPLFKDVVEDFLDFVSDAELIIHNAPFDLGFINHELKRLDPAALRLEDQVAGVVDTLVMARRKYPGQRNSLDHLVKRLEIPPRDRTFHGALLDAEILADVYLAMTGGQMGMVWGSEETQKLADSNDPMLHFRPVQRDGLSLRLMQASAEEQKAHGQYLEILEKESKGACVWKRLEDESA